MAGAFVAPAAPTVRQALEKSIAEKEAEARAKEGGNSLDTVAAMGLGAIGGRALGRKISRNTGETQRLERQASGDRAYESAYNEGPEAQRRALAAEHNAKYKRLADHEAGLIHLDPMEELELRRYRDATKGKGEWWDDEDLIPGYDDIKDDPRAVQAGNRARRAEYEVEDRQDRAGRAGMIAGGGGAYVYRNSGDDKPKRKVKK